MTQSQVLIVQHVPWEKPGRILDNLDDLNMSSTVVNIAKEKKPDLPDFAQVAGLVIMGGPMGALDYDKYPGLKVEAKLVKAAISVGKPVLGVCLGHQIIATALDANSAVASRRKSGSRRSSALTSTITSRCGTSRSTCCTGTMTCGASRRRPAAGAVRAHQGAGVPHRLGAGHAVPSRSDARRCWRNGWMSPRWSRTSRRWADRSRSCAKRSPNISAPAAVGRAGVRRIRRPLQHLRPIPALANCEFAPASGGEHDEPAGAYGGSDVDAHR